MAEITGVTIDFASSPRIVNIPDSAGDVTIQDVIDTLSAKQAEPNNLVYPGLMVNADTAGKQTLSTTKKVGLTLTLNNAQLKFPDQAGPAYVIKRVIDGNIVAVDDAGNPIEPLASSDFTNWKTEADTSAALVEGSSGGFDTTDRGNLENIVSLLGLNLGESVVTSKSLISFGSVEISISTSSSGTVTLTRVS